MRIGIDCRRGMGSGVGRLTQNLVGWMEQGAGAHEVVLFTKKNDAWGHSANVERVETNISYHSAGDFHDFPRIVSDRGIDLFVATQYYIAPFLECATIRFIHDLWPLIHPEWIPSTHEFAARYGDECLRDTIDFGRKFVASPEGQALIAGHECIARFLDEQQHHDIARHYAIMFLLSATRADLIASPSRHSIAEIEAVFPGQAGKARLVPNSVNPIFEPSDATREEFILHVGHWECRKNLEVLLEAFRLLRERGRDVKLVLAGDTGKTDYAARIREQIAAHPHRSAIEQLGLINDRELLDLYQRARLFVCPSLYEGFGIPPVEAMTCGTPAVCARASAMPEVCGDAAHYFEPGSASSLVETLQGLLDDEAVYASLQGKGLARAAMYADDGVERLFISLINEIASRPAPASPTL